MHILIRLILLFALRTITVQLANGLVHKIPTQIHQLPPEIAKQRIFQRYTNNPQMLKLLARSASLEVPEDSPEKNNHTLALSHNSESWWSVQVCNISVGTPPQWFTMEVDWFYDMNMEVIDSNATNIQNADNQALSVFNSSISSTYSPEAGGYYSMETWGSNGHRGQDIVNANGQALKVVFGVLDNPNYNYFRSFYIDAILGLSPAAQRKGTNTANLTTVVQQIANQLDSPVVSVWSESSRKGKGKGQIMLGALDTDHCESNWIFMPKKESSSYYSGYTVHLATMEGTWLNGTQETFKANVDLSIMFNAMGITVDADWMPLFRNISEAVYDVNVDAYVVDCDTTKLGNVTFRVGGRGNGKNSKTYNLTITGADYTSYYDYYDVCYLNIGTGVRSNNEYSMPVILGHNFARNHCLAYNVKDDKIGIADSKTPNTRFVDYD